MAATFIPWSLDAHISYEISNLAKDFGDPLGGQGINF